MVDHFRPITKFALIRVGSITHAFNSDQRYFELRSELVATETRQFPIPVSRPTEASDYHATIGGPQRFGDWKAQYGFDSVNELRAAGSRPRRIPTPA